MKILWNQVTAISLVIALLVIAGFFVNLYMARQAIYKSDHNWCDAINFILNHGRISKSFRMDMLHLHDKFGC